MEQCCKCKGGSQCKCSKVPVFPLLFELATLDHCHCHGHHCTCNNQKERDTNKEQEPKMSSSEEDQEVQTADEEPSTSKSPRHDQLSPSTIPKSPLSKKKSKSKSSEYKGSIFTLEKDGFHICMDVKQFRFSELSVKVVNDEMIVIEAKHAEREDNASGTVSRQIMRKYQIPKETEPDLVKAELSPDGILTVKAPLKKQKPSKERVVKIEKIGNPTPSNAEECHACPCMEENLSEEKKEKEDDPK
uniref:CSON014223 protein n=1 Tax=Culicoides sonorensis TaxID=179676 RepID=A0A336ME09_CULSO